MAYCTTHVQFGSGFGCGVQASISSVIKDFDQRWNLGKLEIDDVGNVVTKGTFEDMERLCQHDRRPPLRPSKVQSMLANDKKFTNNADVDTVAKIYAKFFNAACASDKLLRATQCSETCKLDFAGTPDMGTCHNRDALCHVFTTLIIFERCDIVLNVSHHPAPPHASTRASDLRRVCRNPCSA